jgi:hypothetical protein
VLAGALFLTFAARTIPAPFGDSHDGRNAGVWASGARSLREAGPLDSRLGTRSPEIGVYANHPPLISVETAAAETVGFGTNAATRAPAWIGSLVALGLLGVLLHDRGLRPGPVGVAVLLVAVTPMFLVYGTMLDTPVTSLPFGLGLLVLWERHRAGRPVKAAAAIAVTVLAVLAGWQSLLVATLVGGWAVVRLVKGRGRPERRGAEVAFVIGVVAGGGLLAAWMLWAFGGTLDPLLRQFDFRAGDGHQPVALATLLAYERLAMVEMFGPVAVLGALGLVVALFDDRIRGLAVMVLAATVPYSLVFRTGVVNHDYWNYWFVVPIALGLAAGCDRLTVRGPGHPVWPKLLVGGGVLAALALAAVAVALPPRAGRAVRDGFAGGTVVEEARFSPTQASAWYAGPVAEPVSWLAWAAHRPAVAVPTADLPRLAREHPDDLVLVGRLDCGPPRPTIQYSMEPAQALGRLGGLDLPPFCP